MRGERRTLGAAGLLCGAFTLGCMSGGVGDSCVEDACLCDDIRADWSGECDLGDGSMDSVQIELRLGGTLEQVEGVGVLTTLDGARFPGELIGSCDEPWDTGYFYYTEDERVQNLEWTTEIDGEAHTIVVSVIDDFDPQSLTATLFITGGGSVSSGSCQMYPL